MSEKFCLQWSDFTSNVSSAFQELRQDKDFTDVTLACEDGQQMDVHKVVLVSASPFFKNILKTNKHPHPMIYMRGLKSEDLVSVVDFIYKGEADVWQENLESFLSIAQDLQLKGLKQDQVKDAAENVSTDTFPKMEVNPLQGTSISIQQIAKSKMRWFKALYPVSIPFFIFPFLLFNELLSIVFSISPHSMLRSIYHCIKISLCGLIGVLGQNDHPTSDLV